MKVMVDVKVVSLISTNVTLWPIDPAPHCSKLFSMDKYLKRHVRKCQLYHNNNRSKEDAVKPYLHSYHHLVQLGQQIYLCLQQGVVSEQRLTQDQLKALRLFHHFTNTSSKK